MKFLKCKLCMGEVDLDGNILGVNRKSKCRKCGFCYGGSEVRSSAPEVVVIRKRTQ